MPNNLTQYAAGGVTTTVIGGLTQHKRSDNFETPGVGADASNGGGSDWNTCLLSVTAGTSTYTVNGHVVNGTLGVMDSSGKPVTSGTALITVETPYVNACVSESWKPVLHATALMIVLAASNEYAS